MGPMVHGIFLLQSVCCLLEEILATRYMKLSSATVILYQAALQLICTIYTIESI